MKVYIFWAVQELRREDTDLVFMSEEETRIQDSSLSDSPQPAVSQECLSLSDTNKSPGSPLSSPREEPETLDVNYSFQHRGSLFRLRYRVY